MKNLLRRTPTCTMLPDELARIVDQPDPTVGIPDEAVTLRVNVLYSSHGGRGEYRALQTDRWLNRAGRLVHTARPPRATVVVAFRNLDRYLEMSKAGDFGFLPVAGRHSDVHGDDCDVCPPAGQ